MTQKLHISNALLLRPHIVANLGSKAETVAEFANCAKEVSQVDLNRVTSKAQEALDTMFSLRRMGADPKTVIAGLTETVKLPNAGDLDRAVLTAVTGAWNWALPGSSRSGL